MKIAESRYTALETSINQIRNARKNLLLAKLPEEVEDELLDLVGEALSSLKKIFAKCEPVKGTRGRKSNGGEENSESESENSEDSESEEISDTQELLKRLNQRLKKASE